MAWLSQFTFWFCGFIDALTHTLSALKSRVNKRLQALNPPLTLYSGLHRVRPVLELVRGRAVRPEVHVLCHGQATAGGAVDVRRTKTSLGETNNKDGKKFGVALRLLEPNTGLLDTAPAKRAAFLCQYGPYNTSVIWGDIVYRTLVLFEVT